jgi:hypothetical protein
VTNVPEDIITRLELRDVSAERFDPPRYVGSEYLVFWSEKTEAHKADQEYVSRQGMPVIGIEGCRMNFYQDFIVLGSGLFYIFELKDIR